MLKKIASTVIVGFLGLSSTAHALNLQGYKFSDSYRYSYLEDTGLETFNGPLVLTTSFAHIATPLFVTDSSVSTFKNDVIKRYDLLTLGFGYRFNPHFSMSMETALLDAKVLGKTETALGDTVIRGKWLFLKDGNSGLSLNPSLNIPTGKEANFTTTKSLAAGICAIYEKNWNDLHLLGGVGFSHAGDNTYSIINYRNLLMVELGLSADLNDKWNLNLEINRNFTLATDYRQDEGDYYLTMKNKTFSNGSTYFGAGIAGFDKIDRKNWTVFAGLKFDFLREEPRKIIPHEEKKIEPVVEKPAPKVEAPPTKIIVIKTLEDEKNLGPVFAQENVCFANNKTDIRKGETKKIDQLFVKLIEHSKAIKHIVIEGFASRVGDTKKNQKLSYDRARKVQDALVEKGIPLALTSIVAFGDQAKIQYKDMEKNRRVQFRIYLNKPGE